MKALLIASAFAALFATNAIAQRYDRDFDRDRDRDWERPRGGVPGAILRSLEGDRDDCRIVIRKRRTADGDIVESRRRICD